MTLEDARLSVHGGHLASVSVRAACGTVQFVDAQSCASCSESHFQRVPFLNGLEVSSEAAAKIGTALGCDPLALSSIPSPLMRTVLYVLTLWASCLTLVSGRLARGAAFSPPMIQGTMVCLLIVEAPCWSDPPQLRPVPHLPVHRHQTVSEAVSECAAHSVPGGVRCFVCQRPRLINGLLFHMRASGGQAGSEPIFCPKIQSERVTRCASGYTLWLSRLCAYGRGHAHLSTAQA